MKYIVQHHFQSVGLGGSVWFKEAVSADPDIFEAHREKEKLKKLLDTNGKPMYPGLLVVEAFAE